MSEGMGKRGSFFFYYFLSFFFVFLSLIPSRIWLTPAGKVKVPWGAIFRLA